MTRLEYLRTLYRVLLSREPEATGLTYWVNFLKNQGDPKEVLAQLVESEEYLRRNPLQRPRPDPRRIAAVAKHLAPGHTLTIVDIGAQALDYEDHIYQPLLESAIPCRVIGFDPLADRLQERADREKNYDLTLLPYAIGDGDSHTLYINNIDATSSMYPLNEDVVRRFEDLSSLQTVRTEEIATRRLDDVLNVDSVDFLKLDIQGYELRALESARQTLSRTAVVHCEVEFLPIYAGQPLFADVQKFMLEQGFHFVDLVNEVRLPPAVASGQVYEDSLLFANALFFRNGDSSDGDLRVTQALIASLIYHKHALAESLLQQYDQSRGTSLAEAFAGRSYDPQKQTRDELIADNASLHAQIAARDTELAGARSEVEELRKILVAAESRISALDQQIAIAQKEDANKQQKVAALQQEMDRHQQTHQELIRNQQRAYDILQANFHASQEQVSSLRQQVADSEVSVARLSQDLSEMASALHRDREGESIAHQQLQQVLNSRSFRLLAPARRLRALLFPPRQ
jgi:FkbM family methyltransferase